MKRGALPFFTGNQLKIIALVTMTCDHVAKLFFPESQLLLILGRLAMPIFAWMIAEGCTYTRNRRAYLAQLGGLALLCQVVFFITEGSLYMCILVTFTLSILLIYAVDDLRKEKSAQGALFAFLAVALVLSATIVIPRLPTGTDFYVDYGFYGVLLPVAIYFGRNHFEKLCLGLVFLVLLAMDSGDVQWWSLLTLPLLALYNGQRGKWKMKWLFYIYYPLHLAALWAIDMLI